MLNLVKMWWAQAVCLVFNVTVMVFFSGKPSPRLVCRITLPNPAPYLQNVNPTKKSATPWIGLWVTHLYFNKQGPVEGSPLAFSFICVAAPISNSYHSNLSIIFCNFLLVNCLPQENAQFGQHVWFEHSPSGDFCYVGETYCFAKSLVDDPSFYS